jgi:hypothetical protein
MIDDNNLNFVPKHFPLVEVSQMWDMTFCDETWGKILCTGLNGQSRLFKG